MRIFHKYTGFIVFGIILAFIGLYMYYDSVTSVFFEDYSCLAITTMPEDATVDFSIKELNRLEEIKAECYELPFNEVHIPMEPIP